MQVVGGRDIVLAQTGLAHIGMYAGENLFCIVPAKTKANAVAATLNTEICEKCPATVLRRHSSAVLYLDGDSSSLL